jgi:hypothetical protein
MKRPLPQTLLSRTLLGVLALVVALALAAAIVGGVIIPWPIASF